jgi:hypothetical protein
MAQKDDYEDKLEHKNEHERDHKHHEHEQEKISTISILLEIISSR